MPRWSLLMLMTVFWLPAMEAQVLLKPAADRVGRYLLFFRPDDETDAVQALTPQRLAALRQQQSARIERLKRDLVGTGLVIRHNLWLRGAVAITLPPRHLERAAALDYVLVLRPEKNYRLQSQGVVELPISAELVQDNLAQIGLDSLWAAGYRGQGTVVAILDSGVDIDHQDLATRYRGGSNSWFDPYGEQTRPRDLTGHGTAVASIVLGGAATGAAVGVAPAASWIAARVFDNSGSSSEGAISEALQWLLDPDGDPQTDDYPDIVQNAWGLQGSEGSCINPFEQELSALSALGIDIVFAVGNSGSSGVSSFLTPAFDPHVIAVGALNRDGSLWYESSRGPDRCGNSVIPALVAPGEGIKAATLTYNGFDDDNAAIHHGTSFSSPHVSGALALLRSRFDSSDHAVFTGALQSTAEDLGPPGIDPDFGHGRIRVDAAVEQLEQSLDPRPTEIAFSSARYRFAETDGRIAIELLRSGDLSQAAEVTVGLAAASATPGEDFQAVFPQVVGFAAGSHRAEIELQLIDDHQAEETESVDLVLRDQAAANLGKRTKQRILITDNDTPDEKPIGGASMDAVLLLLLGLLGLSGRRQCAS